MLKCLVFVNFILFISVFVCVFYFRILEKGWKIGRMVVGIILESKVVCVKVGDRVGLLG